MALVKSMYYVLSICTHTVQTSAGWHGALSWQGTHGEAQMKSEGKISPPLSRIGGKIAVLLRLGTSPSGTMSYKAF